jgi:hypothetical protein
MTTFLSSPTAVNIGAPGTTPLGNLAASMQAGSWAKLNVGNQDAVLGVGSISGTMINYCNSMPWNPLSKVVEILGQDHNYPAMRHVRFDAASNRFVLVADNAGIGTGHGYDHVSLNPYNGDLYVRLYSGFSGKISCMKKPFGASAFSAVPDVVADDQVAMGTCWWPGTFVGGGAQGSFMVFATGSANGSATDGVIVAYNPLTNGWFYNQGSKAPFYGSGSTYHAVMEHSAKKNVAVYGGGNVAPDRLWRMDSSGAVQAMPLVPSGKAVGIQRGLITDDPVTGNFLLLSAGELWELNPTGSGSWTALTGSRTPPSGVGIPGPSTIQAVICCSIPEHGVVVYITQIEQTGGTFFLYKHA